MKEKISYSIKRIQSWDAFKEYTNLFSENWIFRGQSNASWELKTSLERSGLLDRDSEIEKSFVNEFKSTAGNFLDSNEMPDSLLEWLALMQHHGAPTRLLDFTKSIYTASYFAFESIESNASHIAIWAINYETLAQRVIDYVKTNKKEILVAFKGSDNLFEKIYNSSDINCIFPIEPYRKNKRYYLQHSVFVSVGNNTNSFMEQLKFLGESLRHIIIKIILPKKITREVLIDLNKMNINSAILFPGLDGYSKSLKMKYSVMRTYTERYNDTMKERQAIKDSYK